MLPGISRAPPLSAKATELLRAAIINGDLPPGTRLVETQLARDFQVSRGPIREALQMLAADGLVQIRPGRGAFVMNPTANEMQDMIVLRAVLNGMAARYVASSRDPDLCLRLEAAVEGMRAAAGVADEKAFFDAHWAFYEAMYQATSSVLNKVWSSLHGLFDLYVRRLGRPYLPLETLLGFHEPFLEIFRGGDPDEAEAVLRSQTLIVGFRILERPIPPELRAYVTREVLPDGTIVLLNEASDGSAVAPPPGRAPRRRERTGGRE